jgi:hypothetical protein
MAEGWINPHVCRCGSGKSAHWLYDARGIELCKACDDCEEKELSKYRADVLDDPNYYTDEPIDDEE